LNAILFNNRASFIEDIVYTEVYMKGIEKSVITCKCIGANFNYLLESLSIHSKVIKNPP